MLRSCCPEWRRFSGSDELGLQWHVCCPNPMVCCGEVRAEDKSDAVSLQVDVYLYPHGHILCEVINCRYKRQKRASSKGQLALPQRQGEECSNSRGAQSRATPPQWKEPVEVVWDLSVPQSDVGGVVEGGLGFSAWAVAPATCPTYAEGNDGWMKFIPQCCVIYYCQLECY